MRARAIVLFAMIVACNPEPKDTPKPGSPGKAQSTDDATLPEGTPTKAQSSAEGTSSMGSGNAATNPQEPELSVNSLTPERWSGRRLRMVYQSGGDGSIGTTLGLLWDTNLKAYCELDDVSRKLGIPRRPGARLYCFPFMGTKFRCKRTYRDPQCSKKVLVAWADIDDMYQELFQIIPKEESDEECDERPAGLYRVNKFNRHDLEKFYYRNERGECVAQEASDEKFHTAEIGEQVPMDTLASGVVAVE